MRPNFLNIFRTRGNNEDVINEVLAVFDDYKEQPSRIVAPLMGYDYTTICRTIFDYVIEHVIYKEDPDGVQYVKTPARLISDGVGDCKSMSIFIASCLYCLQVPFCFRFVSFNDMFIYTHVYIAVMPGTEYEIILDPVERVKGLPAFNYARPYAVKKDVKVEIKAE